MVAPRFGEDAIICDLGPVGVALTGAPFTVGPGWFTGADDPIVALDQDTGLSVPGPGDLLDAGRSVAGSDARAVAAVAPPERIEALMLALERLDGLSQRGDELLDTVEPLTRDALPLASTFVRELSEQKVAAAVQLLDQLRLVEQLESDVLPILTTLDRVGPDIHELLKMLKDVREALEGGPGRPSKRRRSTNDQS